MGFCFLIWFAPAHPRRAQVVATELIIVLMGFWCRHELAVGESELCRDGPFQVYVHWGQAAGCFFCHTTAHIINPSQTKNTADQYLKYLSFCNLKKLGIRLVISHVVSVSLQAFNWKGQHALKGTRGRKLLAWLHRAWRCVSGTLAALSFSSPTQRFLHSPHLLSYRTPIA